MTEIDSENLEVLQTSIQRFMATLNAALKTFQLSTVSAIISVSKYFSFCILQAHLRNERSVAEKILASGNQVM